MGDLRSLEAIGRRWMSSRKEQSQSGANDRRAVGDLCDVDPCAKPGFQWYWERKKDVGKDRAVRLSAPSRERPRIRGQRGAPQELNAVAN